MGWFSQHSPKVINFFKMIIANSWIFNIFDSFKSTDVIPLIGATNDSSLDSGNYFKMVHEFYTIMFQYMSSNNF